MLTDEEAEAIRKELAEGHRAPVLLRWLTQLLQDEERRRLERKREGPRPLAVASSRNKSEHLRGGLSDS